MNGVHGGYSGVYFTVEAGFVASCVSHDTPGVVPGGLASMPGYPTPAGSAVKQALTGAVSYGVT